MKRLKVPVIPVLDVLDITSIEPILEVQSQREFLTHANWHEYPYKPITAFNIARTEKNLYIRYSVQGMRWTIPRSIRIVAWNSS